MKQSSCAHLAQSPGTKATARGLTIHQNWHICFVGGQDKVVGRPNDQGK